MATKPGSQTVQIDPVCGMAVDPAEAADQVTYQGQTYYFCNAACAEDFRRNPEAYTGD